MSLFPFTNETHLLPIEKKFHSKSPLYNNTKILYIGKKKVYDIMIKNNKTRYLVMKKKQVFTKNINKVIISIILLFLVILSSSGCIDDPYHDYQLDSESINIARDSKNNLHVVWAEEGINDNQINIYYTKLNGNGKTIIDDKKIATGGLNDLKIRQPISFNTGGGTLDPDIIVDKRDDVHIVFEIDSTIYYTKQNNEGKILVKPKTLSNNSYKSTDADIALDPEDNLHIVWTALNYSHATIQYLKLNRVGSTLYPVQTISYPDSFDPSIIIDPNGNIYMSWYRNDELSNNWFIEIIETDLQGKIIGGKSIGVNRERTGQFSLEMLINSNDEISIVWTKNRDLVLLPIDDIPPINEESYNPEPIDLEPLLLNFSFEKENQFTLYLDDFKKEHEYFVEITMKKNNYGRVSGEVFLNQDEGEFQTIGDYLLRIYKSPDNVSFIYDVTEIVTGNGKYRIMLEKDYDFIDFEIINVQLVSVPPEEVYINNEDTIEVEDSITLCTENVYEPAVCVDQHGNVCIVWYNHTGSKSELFMLKCDFSGNNVLSKKQLTFKKGKSFDPAFCLDIDNAMNIVWLDRRSGEVEVYYMKVNQNGQKKVKDIKISNSKVVNVEKGDEEEVTDEKLIFSPYLIFCVIFVSIGSFIFITIKLLKK